MGVPMFGKVSKKEMKKGVKGMLDRVSLLKKRAVYVGVPKKTSKRKHGVINNAYLLYIQSHGIRSQSMIQEMQPNLDKGMKYSKAHALYIQSHGSPLLRVPPRPVLEPAIKADHVKITKELTKAIQAAERDDQPAKERALKRAGQEAQNACLDWFEDPRNGWAPNSPATIRRKKSDKPLINIGEMKKSIIYVIK